MGIIGLPGFYRPIEIDATHKDFYLDYGGGSAKALTLGTYACIATLAKHVATLCTGGGLTVTATIDVNDKIVLTGSAAWGITFTGYDTGLRDLLGYSSAQDPLTGSLAYTAAYTPEYCWLPSYGSADRMPYASDQDEGWSGVRARNGRLAGISTGTAIKYRKFTFGFETALKTYEEFATIEIERLRSFEYFYRAARETGAADATNPNPRGFYTFPDRTNCQPVTSMDSGGTDFYRTSSPNTYVFCSPAASGSATPAAALSRSLLYYAIELETNTATAPTWTAP